MLNNETVMLNNETVMLNEVKHLTSLNQPRLRATEMLHWRSAAAKVA